MYIIFVSQRTAGGSNLVVRQRCLPCVSFDELGAAYGLYLLDLVQTVFVMNFAWTALCGGWGNAAALMHTNWCFSMTPIVGGMSEWCAVLCIESSDFSVSLFFRVVVSGWVQIFFAWRVWAVGRSSLWKAVTAVIVAVRIRVYSG
jgi:hypothetical protein